MATVKSALHEPSFLVLGLVGSAQEPSTKKLGLCKHKKSPSSHMTSWQSPQSWFCNKWNVAYFWPEIGGGLPLNTHSLKNGHFCFSWHVIHYKGKLNVNWYYLGALICCEYFEMRLWLIVILFRYEYQDVMVGVDYWFCKAYILKDIDCILTCFIDFQITFCHLWIFELCLHQLRSIGYK